MTMTFDENNNLDLSKLKVGKKLNMDLSGHYEDEKVNVQTDIIVTAIDLENNSFTYETVKEEDKHKEHKKFSCSALDIKVIDKNTNNVLLETNV